jgi:ferredoxin
MTSLDFDFFEKESEERRLFDLEFDKFCEENNVQSIYSWLSQHKLEIQDLIAQNIMKYDNETDKMCLMAAFSEPVLTGRGKRILGTYNGKGKLDSLNDLYVKKQDELLSLLEPQFNKTALERREDYKAAYFAKHGSHATPTDDELPFERKSFIQGPYCHLDIFSKEDNPVSCDWCGTCLNGCPQLLIADETLCYSCHYIALKHVNPSTALKIPIIDASYTKAMKAYETQLAQWQSERFKAERRLSWFEKLFSNTNIYLDEFLENNLKPARPNKEVFDEQKLIKYTLFINRCDDKKPYSRIPILRRDEQTCQMCGFQENEYTDVKLEVHHIWPRAKSYIDHCSNLITLCEPCHNEEKRFDHIRAKPRISRRTSPYGWIWEITPPLLSMTIEDIAKHKNRFGKPCKIDR